MGIDRVELKRQSRERIALTDPKFWIVALAYLAMTTGVSWLVSLIPVPSGGAGPVPVFDLSLFFQLLLTFYTTVVRFGLCLWALWTYRQLDPDVNSLMQGFSVAGRVILMELGIYVRVLGWYFVVAFVLSIPVFFLLLMDAGSGIGMLSLLILAVGLIATIIFFNLRFALAPYLLADRPDDGPTAPIFRSSSLMRGWKWELFKLEFSFLGWEAINFVLSKGVILLFLSQAGLLTTNLFLDDALLNQAIDLIYSAPVVILSTLVTVPVSLWLIPYRETARAGFYDARLLAASDAMDQPDMPPL
ncbi:MAG: DUF975 family protein [Lawsonibacter sp.]|nr:DUF975 family protein [Lawsonibacter sp.]